jgi:tetratricopeptide (TPR) repeat protein
LQTVAVTEQDFKAAARLRDERAALVASLPPETQARAAPAHKPMTQRTTANGTRRHAPLRRCAGAAHTAPALTRRNAAQELHATLAQLRAPDEATRRAAASALGALDPAAAPLLASALHDSSAAVHAAAEASLWALWARSGDAAIDAMLQSGMRTLAAAAAAAGPSALHDALQAFTAVTEAAPSFAEGWNKRATVLYLLKEYEASLECCRRVIALNPVHFGALSGGGMCALSRGDLPEALRFFTGALKVNPRLDGAAQYVIMLTEATEALREDPPGRGKRGEEEEGGMA